MIGLASLTSDPWTNPHERTEQREMKQLLPGKRGRLQPGVEIRFAGSNLVGRVE